MEDQDTPVNVVPEKYRADINFGEYDAEKLDPPEWITDLDREILALLGNSMIIMTPSVIGKNLDRSRSSVSHRLTTLEAGGMIEKVERGHYKISNEGYARMRQKAPCESPPGRDDSENWVTYKILTPEEIDVIKKKGHL